MDNRRLLLAAGLSMAVLFLWQLIFPPPEPPVRPAPPAAVAAAGDASASGAAAPTASQPRPDAEAAAPAAAAPIVDEPPVAAAAEEKVVLEGGDLRVELTNRGAQLVSVVLGDKRLADGSPLELVARRGESPLPFAIVAGDGTPHPLNGALFAIEERSATSVRFAHRGPAGSAEKRITLGADGRIEVVAELRGGWNGGGLLIGPGLRTRTTEELENRFLQRAAVYRTGGEVVVQNAPDVEAPLRLSASALDWFALEDTYFLTAVVAAKDAADVRLEPVTLQPVAADPKSFDGVPFASEDALSADEKSRQRDLRFVIAPKGERLELSTVWSAKQFDRLRAFGNGLEETVRWGWMGFLARPLLRALQWIHATITPNYGWAIVVMTTALKIVLLPLSIASFKSMRTMQKLAPKMQAIRERWRPKMRDKNGRFNPDAQRQMNEEVMGLYRQEGVNPAGGCLPMLAQLPIFFAFYQLLSTAVELWNAPWIAWVVDLTAPDPYKLLPILMGATQFAQQLMMPPPPDPMQKRMMQFLPIVFTLFSFAFPSGLVLYWLTNNVLSIGQQAIYNRIQEQHEAEAAGAEKPARGKKKKS